VKKDSVKLSSVIRSSYSISIKYFNKEAPRIQPK